MYTHKRPCSGAGKLGNHRKRKASPLTEEIRLKMITTAIRLKMITTAKISNNFSRDVP